MRLRWMPSAAADLASISDYLTASRPAFRDRTIRQIHDTLRALRKYPNRGRLGKRPGTREILFQPMPYLAIYRIQEDTIEVLRILHGAQQR